jgi:hypothetical protein
MRCVTREARQLPLTFNKALALRKIQRLMPDIPRIIPIRIPIA